MGPETVGRQSARRYAGMQGVSRSEASRLLRRKCGAAGAPTRIATAQERFATGWHKGRTAPLIRRSSVALLFPVLLVAATLALGQERFEQDKLSIRGNKALPKTLYIAPWKHLGSPLDGGDLNSRLEDKLDPVEQDLLRKELELHRDGYSVD